MAFFGMKPGNTALSTMMKRLQAAGEAGPGPDDESDIPAAQPVPQTTAQPQAEPVNLKSIISCAHKISFSISYLCLFILVVFNLF
jgi:hypothetical protein